jgi:hypothetical protein
MTRRKATPEDPFADVTSEVTVRPLPTPDRPKTNDPFHYHGLDLKPCYLTAHDLQNVLDKASKGIHPIIAFKSIGKWNVYSHLLHMAENFPQSTEFKIIYLVERYYFDSLCNVIGAVHQQAIQRGAGQVALNAAKMLFDLNQRLDNHMVPLISMGSYYSGDR